MSSRLARSYDERDVRVRASRRGTKPRTKDRPDYSASPRGVVWGVDRGRYRVRLDDGSFISAMRARALPRKSVVIGDVVALKGDLSGSAGSLARVVEVDERRNTLRRSADDNDHIERVIVANMDQMVMVVAADNPPPRPGMLDRCLVVARVEGIEPLVIVTKTDIGSAESLSQWFDHIDVDFLPLSVKTDGSGLDEVRERLAGQKNVFIGHSGVGKSTLVNELVPDAQRDTGEVNAVTGRGRHTSSSAVMFDLPGGGTIVDTPGVRSFGLAHLDGEQVIDGFDELREVAEMCPKLCDHTADDCEIRAVALHHDEEPRRRRAQSLLTILASRHAT